MALYEEIAAAAPENTVADPRIWGTWRMLWASDNKYRGPFGKGPIAPFYRVKDLTQVRVGAVAAQAGPGRVA